MQGVARGLVWSLPPLLLVAAALGGTGCGTGSGSAAGEGGVNVVGYSTPEVVYEHYLEPGFHSVGAGRKVEFGNSFGQSGAQRRAIEAGAPTTVVQTSDAGEMEALVKAGIVAPDWDEKPFGGMIQRSVIVIAVPKGNPSGLRSFADLFKEPLRVAMPDPLSADAGRWGTMAVYGSLLHEGKSEDQALAGTERLLKKSATPAATGAEALEALVDGRADAAVVYESEAITAQKEGKGIEYVLPGSTIYVESPIAVTKGAPKAAREFLHYMWTTAGQELWIKKGYRPVKVYVLNPIQFPKPDNLFKISGLGGWAKVDREFFDPRTGSIAKFERTHGG